MVTKRRRIKPVHTVRANAVGANAEGANAVGANAVLEGANAVGANAVGANAVGANAVGANAEGANAVTHLIVPFKKGKKTRRRHFYGGTKDNTIVSFGPLLTYYYYLFGPVLCDPVVGPANSAVKGPELLTFYDITTTKQSAVKNMFLQYYVDNSLTAKNISTFTQSDTPVSVIDRLLPRAIYLLISLYKLYTLPPNTFTNVTADSLKIVQQVNSDKKGFSLLANLLTAAFERQKNLLDALRISVVLFHPKRPPTELAGLTDDDKLPYADYVLKVRSFVRWTLTFFSSNIDSKLKQDAFIEDRLKNKIKDFLFTNSGSIFNGSATTATGKQMCNLFNYDTKDLAPTLIETDKTNTLFVTVTHDILTEYLNRMDRTDNQTSSGDKVKIYIWLNNAEHSSYACKKLIVDKFTSFLLNLEATNEVLRLAVHAIHKEPTHNLELFETFLAIAKIKPIVEKYHIDKAVHEAFLLNGPITAGLYQDTSAIQAVNTLLVNVNRVVDIHTLFVFGLENLLAYIGPVPNTTGEITRMLTTLNESKCSVAILSDRVVAVNLVAERDNYRSIFGDLVDHRLLFKTTSPESKYDVNLTQFLNTSDITKVFLIDDDAEGALTGAAKNLKKVYPGKSFFLIKVPRAESVTPPVLLPVTPFVPPPLVTTPVLLPVTPIVTPFGTQPGTPLVTAPLVAPLGTQLNPSVTPPGTSGIAPVLLPVTASGPPPLVMASGTPFGPAPLVTPPVLYESDANLLTQLNGTNPAHYLYTAKSAVGAIHTLLNELKINMETLVVFDLDDTLVKANSNTGLGAEVALGKNNDTNPDTNPFTDSATELTDMLTRLKDTGCTIMILSGSAPTLLKSRLANLRNLDITPDLVPDANVIFVGTVGINIKVDKIKDFSLNKAKFTTIYLLDDAGLNVNGAYYNAVQLRTSWPGRPVFAIKVNDKDNSPDRNYVPDITSGEENSDRINEIIQALSPSVDINYFNESVQKLFKARVAPTHVVAAPTLRGAPTHVVAAPTPDVAAAAVPEEVFRYIMNLCPKVHGGDRSRLGNRYDARFDYVMQLENLISNVPTWPTAFPAPSLPYPTTHAYAGLNNIENTCFYNTILHAVWHCVPLRETLIYFIKNSPIKYRNLVILQNTLENLYSTSQTKQQFAPNDQQVTVSTANGYMISDQGIFTEYMKNIYMSYRAGQEDAPEVLLAILKQFSGDNYALKEEERPFYKYTGMNGLLEHAMLKCEDRSNYTYITAAGSHVSFELPIPENMRQLPLISLQDLIKDYHSDEVIASVESCRNGQGTKRSRFTVHPCQQSLVISLKRRFIAADGFDTKLENPVTLINNNVTIPYIDFNLIDDFATFEVASIIVHIGGASGGGHYIAYTPVGIFNDSVFTQDTNAMNDMCSAGTHNDYIGYSYLFKRVYPLAVPQQDGYKGLYESSLEARTLAQNICNNQPYDDRLTRLARNNSQIPRFKSYIYAASDNLDQAQSKCAEALYLSLRSVVECKELATELISYYTFVWPDLRDAKFTLPPDNDTVAGIIHGLYTRLIPAAQNSKDDFAKIRAALIWRGVAFYNSRVPYKDQPQAPQSAVGVILNNFIDTVNNFFKIDTPITHESIVQYLLKPSDEISKIAVNTYLKSREIKAAYIAAVGPQAPTRVDVVPPAQPRVDVGTAQLLKPGSRTIPTSFPRQMESTAVASDAATCIAEQQALTLLENNLDLVIKSAIIKDKSVEELEFQREFVIGKSVTDFAKIATYVTENGADLLTSNTLNTRKLWLDWVAAKVALTIGEEDF